MTKCKNCGKQIPDWFDYCNDNCFNAHQYKIFEKQNKQYEATIAAMRQALEEIQEVNSNWHGGLSDSIREITNKALSNTAGQEILTKVKLLDKQVKNMQCCENCQKYGTLSEDCDECFVGNSQWVIAERLVKQNV